MKHLEILTQEQVGPEVQEIFQGLKKKIGMIPNVYKLFANSPVAFKAFLEMEKTLEGGFFSPKEIQAIELMVSQVNECHYCLAAHTALGKMAGFSEQETLDLRSASIDDEKLRALTALAREITIQRGRPDDEYINDFFGAGYGKQALVELVAFVSIMNFSNFINNIAHTSIDFPLAKELKTAA